MAALVAMAFVRQDLPGMVDAAAALLPRRSLLFWLVQDMRAWADKHGDDWRATLAGIRRHYPYSRFGTPCPLVSNHAIILLALLHGGGDFSRSLMIAATAGYDTDCNCGNVGCILGVLPGLPGIDGSATDWRGPVADRLYLPTADSGRAITDAVREADAIVNIARALRALPAVRPKNGARFHFSPPGSVQGWQGDGMGVDNSGGRLRLRCGAGATGRAGTATWLPPEAFGTEGGGYGLVASPTLYAGQMVTAVLAAADAPLAARLYVKTYGADDSPVLHFGPAQTAAPAQPLQLSLRVPDTDGSLVYEVGLEVTAGAAPATAYLEWLTWSGAPQVTLTKPPGGTSRWSRAWMDAMDEFGTEGVSPGFVYRVIQNSGTGLATQGEAAWSDYTVSADVWLHLATRVGMVAAGRGLRRYVVLVLDADKRVRLVRQHDNARTTLTETGAMWDYEQKISLSLTVTAAGGVSAAVDGCRVDAPGDGLPLSGAVGFLVEQGHAEWGPVTVRPAEK